MLLKDMGVSGQSKIDKINKFLSSKYGVKITENTDLGYLHGLKDDISSKIRTLRVDGGFTPKDPELIKELLILEGVDTLIEHRAAVHQEIGHRPYRRMLDQYSDDAVAMFTKGDSYETSVNKVMDE